MKEELEKLFNVYSLKAKETSYPKDCITEPYFECLIDEILELAEIKNHTVAKEELDEFKNELLPQAFFHVSKNDIDDVTGGKLGEVILVEMLAANIGVLKYHPLDYWIKTYLEEE